MTQTYQNFKNSARKMNKPNQVDSKDWANAVNWSIEAWKCHLNGQKWAHSFEICCPEQYYMLLTKNGNFILDACKDVVFANNKANSDWAFTLKSQIIEMQTRGEWVEALHWTRLLEQLNKSTRPTPNEDNYARTKKTIKGYKLIRINSAA